MRTLGRRYRLEEELGTGGMAVVWRAQDLVLGRQVAVKQLGPSFSDRAARERIKAEARVAARLAHPNVASVYDFGESRRVPYIVMELVQGDTLAVRQQSDRMHWRTAVGIAAEVAAALAAAHACGVVHRDIKPGNIMLARTGVKVVDFGIAAAVGDLEDHGDELLGTPAYVAPERFAGRPAAPATDVYALGILLFQCLTGSLPWPAYTATELVTAHRELPPAPLPPIPGLPDDVVELCHQCLSKEPDERPSSLYAAVVLAEAAGLAVTLPAVDGFVPAPAPVQSSASDSTQPVRPRLPRRLPRRLSRGRLSQGGLSHGGFSRGGLSRSRHRVVNGYLSQRISIGRFSIRRVIGGLALAGVVAIVALSMGLGLWSNDTEGPSGAAATPSGGCSARYVAASGTGGAFTAEVAVTNTGRRRLDTWSLKFALPVGQRITDARGLRFVQSGDSVTLHSDQPLEAGGTRRLALTGSSASSAAGPPAAPTRITLQGAPCTSTIGGTAQAPGLPR